MVITSSIWVRSSRPSAIWARFASFITSTNNRLYIGWFGVIMIPTLLSATIVFVIAFIAAPPVHLFVIAALGFTSGTSCVSTRSAEFTGVPTLCQSSWRVYSIGAHGHLSTANATWPSCAGRYLGTCLAGRMVLQWRALPVHCLSLLHWYLRVHGARMGVVVPTGDAPMDCGCLLSACNCGNCCVRSLSDRSCSCSEARESVTVGLMA